MNFISKNGRKTSFSYESKHRNLLSQWGEYVYGAQYGKKGDYYVNPCLSQLKDELEF